MNPFTILLVIAFALATLFFFCYVVGLLIELKIRISIDTKLLDSYEFFSEDAHINLEAAVQHSNKLVAIANAKVQV